MRDQEIKISFAPPKSGWLVVTVIYRDEEFRIYSSDVFDPYEDFLTWLENLAEGNFPCRWHINEEDTFMAFEVTSVESGKTQLILKGNQRCDDYEDTEVYTFIDEIVDPLQIARSFYEVFREFLESDYDRAEWGSGLEKLESRRIPKLEG